MAARDPYEVLGVERKASEADIKKAYRRLARKFHPDVNAGDSAAKKKFQEIAAAYEVVKDPKRRKHFDQTGDTGGPPEPGAPRPQGSGPFGGGNPFGGSGRGPTPGAGPANFRWSGDFGDLFSDLFSGAGSGGRAGGARGFGGGAAHLPLAGSFEKPLPRSLRGPGPGRPSRRRARFRGRGR